MDSEIMGTIMMAIVMIGMSLSVIQLIGEIVLRRCVTACQAFRDEAVRELYARPPGPQETSPSTPVATVSNQAAA